MTLAPAIATANDAARSAVLADLRDDLDELLFLTRDTRSRLEALAREHDSLRPTLHAPAFDLLRTQVGLLHARFGELGRRVLGQRQLALSPSADVAALARERDACKELLRTQQLVVAALATAADWQSPPFLTATPRGGGAELGRVSAHWNDYKRDRHLDALEYERAYVAELVDGPAGVRALLTSCGMAALTTILGHLAPRCEGKILAGAAVYHETKLLLERLFGGRVAFAAEPELPDAIRGIRPDAVFVDSLCNTRWAPVTDVEAVASALADCGREAFLVVDNTGLASSFQPLRHVPSPSSVRPIVFESLLKYHQLGLDRVNAGVVVAPAELADGLEAAREHLGTNLTDVSAYALPRPCRHVLERRLARIERNAGLLAERLELEASPALEAVVYPGLRSHPCYASAGRLGFRGGCVSLVFRDPPAQTAFVAEAVASARAAGVPLVGGSSFGFDTTRLYVTAARAEAGEPFVRVAAGTEHRRGVDAVGDVLADALVRAARLR